jgi:hypothetical protein
VWGDRRPNTHHVTAVFGAFTWQGNAPSLDRAYAMLDQWAEDADKAPDHASVREMTPQQTHRLDSVV